jgi:hypothetical protein
MNTTELISYKHFIDDVLYSLQYRIDLSKYRSTEVSKISLRRALPIKSQNKLSNFSNMTLVDEEPTSVSENLRRQLKLLFRDNLVATG